MKNRKKRIFEIIQIGTKEDVASTVFDYLLVAAIVVNLSILVVDTFAPPYHVRVVLDRIEYATLAFFVVEYALRIWTAEYAYPDEAPGRARFRFFSSLEGLIDLFTILPYFLPIFFPSGLVAFRVLRVLRIFRLFRINAQYDSFNVIIDVIKNKREQLFSSLCIIFIMMK